MIKFRKTKRVCDKKYYSILLTTVDDGKYINKITIYSDHLPVQTDKNVIEVDGVKMVFEEPVRIY